MSAAVPPAFSLIMCTRGRVAEIGLFLGSLLAQSCSDLELIVVDQNGDDRLDATLARFSSQIPIRHLRHDGQGAASARNAGLDHATGALIGFPDDDCRYLPAYLDAVARIFEDNPALDGLTGQTTDEERRHDGETMAGSQELGPFTVHNRCQEFTIVVRRERLGGARFNERMGVGARTLWGADEGPELLIRLMSMGCTFRFFPRLFVYHPNKTEAISRKTLARAASYARGRGCLLRLHRFPKSMIFENVFRAAAGCGVYLLTLRPARSIYYLTIFGSLLRGLLMSRSELAEVAAGDRSMTVRKETVA